MNPTTRSLLATALIVGLAACNKPAEQPGAEQKPAATPSAPVATGPVAVPVPKTPVDTLARTPATQLVNSIPGLGTIRDGALVGNGRNGYLMFGPYVPFQAGRYTVTFKGRLMDVPKGGNVRFDAVSAKGKTAHGQLIVDQLGDIGSFDMILDQPVSDLEIRARVNGGSKVAIEGYEVVRKP